MESMTHNDHPASLAACFECGSPADHEHHVIPKVYGGKKTIPLCSLCHGKVHDIKFTNHSELTKEGLRKAKARGVVLGRNGHHLGAANKAAADVFAADLKPVISSQLAAGFSRAEMASDLNRRQIPTARGGRWHVTTVQNLVNRLGL